MVYNHRKSGCLYQVKKEWLIFKNPHYIPQVTGWGKPLLSMGKPLVSMGKPLVSMGKPLFSMGKPLLSMGKPLLSMLGSKLVR